MLFNKHWWIAAILLMVSAPVFSQTPPPGGTPPIGAPIDGMTSVLLATGAFYAIKKFRSNQDR